MITRRKKDPTPKKTCFLLSPIGSPNSPERKRADDLLDLVLDPVLNRSGYKVVRADKIAKVGVITTQIIKSIINSPLVVADLTGGNPNVFYELAIRHATGLPYIQLIDPSEKIPFDVSPIRTIPIDLRDLRSVEQAKAAIQEQITEFEKGHCPDSPISIARAVGLLQSDESVAGNLLTKVDRVDENICYQSRQINGLQMRIDALSREFSDLMRAYWHGPR